MAYIQKFISTSDRIGRGDSMDDPVRMVRQLWTLDGVLIAEHDPCRPTESWFEPDRIATPEAQERTR